MPYMWDPQGNRHWVPTMAEAQAAAEEGWTYVAPTSLTPEQLAEVPTPPPAGTQVGQIPGTVANRFLYQIGGRYYLVYEAPVRWTTDPMGNVTVTDTVPIAYECSPLDLVQAGIISQASQFNGMLRDTLTLAEWNAMGGIVVGDVSELNNVDENPFEFLATQIEENAVLYPWLMDPEIMALTAAAWLEGRSLTEAELAGTSWWQSHTDAERNWLTTNSQSPQAAAQLLRDNRLMVLEMLQASGVNNAPDTLVNLLADHYTMGSWTETYLGNQVDLLADPTKRGDLDEVVTSWLTGEEDFTLDTTQSRRDRVQELAWEWLGPVYGALTPADLDRWAGQLRNDPDAEQRLIQQLQRQRITFFPAYTDPQASYQDIATPWRNLVLQLWGREADETSNTFVDVVRLNDLQGASQLLRQEGLRQGVGQVVDDMLADLSDAFGDQVVRAQ